MAPLWLDPLPGLSARRRAPAAGMTGNNSLWSIGKALGRGAAGSRAAVAAAAEDEERAEEAAQKGAADAEAVRPLTPRTCKRLLQPPPNLLRASFGDVQRPSHAEQWLQQRIAIFDAGSNRRRKQVLEEFLEFVATSGATGMEQLFSVQAKFFFARITSWFAVTVPLLFELPLQVRALMVFLAYNEECFLHAFFETGVVEPLMRTLSVICDAPDEVRSFAIAMLHKLALGGKRQKQLLCERGLPGATAECIISGGLRWGAVRAAGRMLLELFRGNPLHQENVLQTLLVLLGQRAPLAQRVSAETLATLFASEREVSSRLTDPSVHATVVELALQLLQSDDLHASADAYRLLVCMVQSFGCDELLRDFARSQLQDERNLAEEWMRLEADIQRATTPKHRHRGATLWLHRAVAKAVVGEPAEGLEDLTREDVLAELDDDFRTEAAHVFRWGLVMCLVRRDEVFCDELVQDGLAETLLVCLLNTTQPVCQAVALVEVHRLRLISRHTEWLTEQVLSFEMMRAVTLEQFMAASSPESLARSRCRLRNIRQEARGARHSAQEIALRQHLVEHAMMDVMKSTSSGAADGGDSGGVFLTATAVGGRDEGAGAGEAMGANAATDDHLGDGAGATASDDAEVPRSGSGIFSVQRVPPASAGGAGSAGLGASLLAGPGGGDGAGGYQVMLGPADEIPFMGSLVSMLIDLADGDGLGVHVDASGNFSGSGMNLVGRSSVLIRGGVAGASGTSLPSDTRSNCGRELAASGSFLRLDGMQQRHNQHGNSSSRGDHRPTAQHLRALALRPLAPRGVESHPPALLRRRGPPVAASALLPPLAPSRADSDATELSLRIVDELHSKASAHHDHHDHCHGCPSHMVSVDEASLLEDSVTTDLKPNFSQRYLSSIADTSLGPEQQSWSTSQDPLAGGPSWLSAGTSDHLPDDSTYWNFADEMNDYHMVKMHKGSTVALLDLRGARRRPDGSRHRSHSARSSATDLLEPLETDVAASASARSGKKVLHVQRPPYHECVAFSATIHDYEEGHRHPQDAADRTLDLLHPDTRRKFSDLRDMGREPRAPLAPMSARVASKVVTDDQPEPHSARFLRQVTGGSGSAKSDLSFAPPPWLAKGAGPRGRQIEPQDPNAPMSMRGFFPAVMQPRR